MPGALIQPEYTYCAGVLEVRAEVVLHLLAHRSHRLVEDVLNKGHTSATAGTSFCARFDIANRLAGAVLNSLCDIAWKRKVSDLLGGCVNCSDIPFDTL